MSKTSQSWYKHGILDSLCNEGRYSITIRQVNLDNDRGLLIIGDSNTKEIEFGAGKGKMGERFPGKRVKAATINDIDPTLCGQYRNVALMCGTNDLRPGGPPPDIEDLVKTYSGKISQIKRLNPNCRVFVVPVLPTRNFEMNKLVMMFNRNMSACIKQNFDYSVKFPPMYAFLDSGGLLALPLTRNGDSIHLGRRGLGLLVSIIKKLIYSGLERPDTRQQRTRNAGTSRPA